MEQPTQQGAELVEVVWPGEIHIACDLHLSAFSDGGNAKDHDRNRGVSTIFEKSYAKEMLTPPEFSD